MCNKKQDGVTFSGQSSGDERSDHTVLARTEVISRLRDRGEPVLLFGETEVEAFKRLRRCEILEPEVNRGFRNDFQEAMEQVDQDYLDEILASGESSKEDAKSGGKPQESVVPYEDIKLKAKELGRGTRENDMTIIMHFLQLLLKMWGDQLQDRTKQEKRSTRGKMTGATYTQTQVYLRPLLRKLKTHTLPEDILESLTEITLHLLNRNYLKVRTLHR